MEPASQSGDQPKGFIRSWFAPGPRDGSERDKRTLSLAFALLFGSGGVLVLYTLLLPHSSDRDIAGLIGPAACALVIAVLLVGFGRGFPMWLFRAMPLSGAVLVSIVSISGGESAVSGYAMFCLWVVLAAFYFFPGWWAVVNLVAIGFEYSLVTRVSHTQSAELKWVMLMGTLVVAGVFLSMLQEHADRAAAERERLLARVEELASTDPLTSLPNRRAWQARLVEELRRAARREAPLALVVLDLDGLKAINDVGGHHAGERVIKRATAGWSSALRDTDFIARLGGDEFAVLLPDCPEKLAGEVVHRMREAASSVEWSAGIAVWDGEEHARALLERADSMLYEAKGGGRNRAVGAADAAV